MKVLVTTGSGRGVIHTIKLKPLESRNLFKWVVLKLEVDGEALAVKRRLGILAQRDGARVIFSEQVEAEDEDSIVLKYWFEDFWKGLLRRIKRGKK